MSPICGERVWVITGMTQSGDDIKPIVLDEKPSEPLIKVLLWENHPEEFEDPLDGGSHHSINYEVWETIIQ